MHESRGARSLFVMASKEIAWEFCDDASKYLKSIWKAEVWVLFESIVRLDNIKPSTRIK